MDQVLAITGAREVKAFLEGEGVSVEYHEYPMAHEISRESLDDMATWLFEQIGDSAS
jgi:phospholipase/carboxylesterase